MGIDMGKEKEMQHIPTKEEAVDISMDDIRGSDEVISQEEALAKISMILARTDNPEALSDLNPNEIIDMAILKTLAQKYEMDYDSQLLKNFVQNYLVLQVSKRRKGRKEIIEVASSNKVNQDDGRRKFFGRF